MTRLILKNFRCYKDKTFDLGGNGITLLQGKSGAGKTTILMAINFVLYGVGTNLIHEGCSNCYVELYFSDLYIKRTKKPNKLLLIQGNENVQEYEDDSAQSIINKIFTDSFDICGYIAQNSIGSFITMSPTDKLEFLEKISFNEMGPNGINLSNIKTKCKNIIKSLNEKLIELNSKIEITKNVIDTKIKPNKIPYPLKCGIKQREIGEKNLRIKIKKNLSTINLKTNELQIIRNKFTDTIILDKYIQTKKNELDYNLSQLENIILEKNSIYLYTDTEINDKKMILDNINKYNDLIKTKTKIINDITNITDKININTEKYNNLCDKFEKLEYCGNDKLLEYKDMLKIYILQKNINEFKSKYEKNNSLITNIKLEETNKLKCDIQLIKDKLWKNHNKTTCNELLSIYRIKLRDFEELFELYNKLKQYDIFNLNIKLKELLDKYEIYKCPVCNSNLKFDDTNTLIECKVKDMTGLIESPSLIPLEPPRTKFVISDNPSREAIKIDEQVHISKEILDSRELRSEIELIKNKIFISNNLIKNIDEIINKYDIKFLNQDISNEIQEYLKELYQNIDTIKKYLYENELNEKTLESLNFKLENNDIYYGDTLKSLIKDNIDINIEIEKYNKLIYNIDSNGIKLSLDLNLNEDQLREIINKQELLNHECKLLEDNINKLDYEIENDNYKLNELEFQLKQINLEINKGISITDDIYNLDNINTFLLTAENNRNKYNKLEYEKNKLDNKISEYKYDINKQLDEYNIKYNDNINVYNISKGINEIELKIKSLEDELKELDIQKNEFQDYINKLEKYIQYEKERDDYNSWDNKLKDLIIQETELKSEYIASCIFKDKITESESIAMMNIIDSINHHANIYLDDFFPDNPILIRLLPFKEVKKSQKPQINLEIEYKGMECDLKYLSGGELSRVILAFTLALADMFNVPLILLDEVTSSLDQDMNSIIIESVKTHFTNKLVLLISHQSLTGIYDKIINI
jgi:DNA repair exonuclease SbcCD ATPase subunit